MKPRDTLSRGELAFYLLVILCGFLIVGRLDYADAVMVENERLQSALVAERAALAAECSADIEHLDRTVTAHPTQLEM